MSSESRVGTPAIQEAVRGRETEVLAALRIAWADGAPHITCPYPAHADDNPSWRWDEAKRRAQCSCTERSQSIFDVVMRCENLDSESAKLRVAEILGRSDLVKIRDGQRHQAMDAASLLRPIPDQHEDTLTVVRDARGSPLTKRYQLRGGRVVKSNYPNVAEVVAAEVPVHDINSLAAALDSVSAGGIAAVIRAAPGKFHPRRGQPAFRLLHPQEGQAAAKTGNRISPELIRRNKLEPDGVHRYAATWLPTFEDRPRFWVIFDVDRVPVPDHLSGDWVDEPEAAVEHVLDTLPAAFRGSTCWWSLSGSAAVPGPNGREVSRTFKLKLAFWLSQALNGAQLKRWMAAEEAPVDPAVFGAVQLIYLASPGFGHGLHDPVPRRSGIWQGETDTVMVPELLPEPAAGTYDGSLATFGPAEGLDELCEVLRARLAGELHVREHLMQAARAYLRQHGPTVDQAALVAALEAIAGEHRSCAEVAGYGVDRLIDHLVRQERATAWMPFGRPAPKGILRPYFGDEAPNLFREANRQRHFLRDWLQRNCLYALARREIASRRAAAFEAAGLA